MLRICRQCATQYEGKPDSTLCPNCVAASRKNVIRDRICRECGISFPGGPRAWYCPDCRRERRRGRDIAYKKSGAARALGSIDICVVCGGEYIVTGGRQRYCPTCAPEAIKSADREQGKRWYADNADPDQRREIRRAHAAPIACKVCGKYFIPRDPSLTCSPACQDALRRKNHREFEQSHRELRNERQRASRAAQSAAMTPEEREVWRVETNRKWRENYRKRKEKKNNDPD